MSAQPAYSHLRAERGGQAPAVALPPAPARMTPAEIPLTLSADVLRLPCPPATRLVLAEIVSLHAANAGCCDASDAHFVARLTLSTNTVSRAIQQLHDEGLIVKSVDKSKGFYRTLVPVVAAIEAAAAANPYPQNGGSYPQNGGRATPKMGTTYPQNGASPTPKTGDALPPKWGTNTPSNIPVNFQLNPDDAACAAGGGEAEKKIGLEEISHPALADPHASASHTEGGAADVATRKPPKPAKVAPEDEPAFLAFWHLYPRSEGKVKAAQSFARLKPEEQAQATELVVAFFARRPTADYFGKEGQDYRPHAATWLNNKRWKECAEPLPTPPPTATPTHASAQGYVKPGAARHHVPKVNSYGKL